jgi:putative oxidoreductase
MIGKINSLFEGMAENSKELSWTLFRVLVSAQFMTHGFDKLFGEDPQAMMGSGLTSINIGEVVSWPMPMEINALFLAGVVELFGGLLIAIGLWTHLVALIATFTMIMAYLIVHLAWFPTMNGGELSAMYILSFFVIFSFGPGQYSADTWLSVRRQEKRRNKMDAHKL